MGSMNLVEGSEPYANARHEVSLLTRVGCGSCVRVREQITPLLMELSVPLQVIDVDTDSELKAEFGDRLPVLLLDGEEYAAWEVDNDELREDLQA